MSTMAVRPMPKFGKRETDTPFSMWLTALQVGGACTLSFCVGVVTTATTAEILRSSISSFAGGAVATSVIVLGLGKPLFEFLKQTSEAEISSLKTQLEDEIEGRDVDKKAYEKRLGELERLVAGLEQAISIRKPAIDS